ncbi:translesion error-prone DNA polymerase V autoproteolytic subunit [Arthrobacter sp. EH-1B-1]|uniref:Translesion error-prone DNA polymerase V autoproteolytic subunit n=1 Tax=Arthrobacter vasquezii TaxID=2977629 RepID=A0ABT6CU22_9MICC|nr:translesion error-prone DNA polymerase V autoproteolytic subunit [Arthrobacter vasquezii]MDF9277385.1 translesion error-prone DNA polymerase V autoproteolytic subunit [Arthrobacter vasquezii]
MTIVVDVREVRAIPPVVTVLSSPVSIPAGFPSPAQDYYDKGIDLNAHLIKDVTSTFIVRVSGDSMSGAGISDGDELVVDRSLTPLDGSVVVAVLDGELTIKRLRITRRGVVLAAENPSFPDIVVPELGDLSIWGVVTRCLHYV